MTPPQEKEKKERYSRIRRVKKLLRPLPRRANVHRYPFIKWFANAARKRPYLWSFRVKEVTPALYAGFILTFIPLYGVQIPAAFLLSILFRANLPILVGLQLISNPLTVPPIYVADYHIGNFILDLLGDAPDLPVQVQEMDVEAIADLPNKNGFSHVKKGFRIFGCMIVGGTIIGYFCGLISSTLYQIIAKRVRKHKGTASKAKKE